MSFFRKTCGGKFEKSKRRVRIVYTSNMYVCNSKIIHFIFIKSHFTAHDCIIINVFLENKVVRISIIVLFGAKALNGTN